MLKVARRFVEKMQIPLTRVEKMRIPLCTSGYSHLFEACSEHSNTWLAILGKGGKFHLFSHYGTVGRLGKFELVAPSKS